MKYEPEKPDEKYLFKHKLLNDQSYEDYLYELKKEDEAIEDELENESHYDDRRNQERHDEL